MLKADQVEWVVNDIAELGVKIGDQFFFLYKGSSLVYGTDEKSRAAGACLNEDTDPPTRHKWRRVFKRELKALRAVEEWWLSEGMKHFAGAPYAIFATRDALRPLDGQHADGSE